MLLEGMDSIPRRIGDAETFIGQPIAHVVKIDSISAWIEGEQVKLHAIDAKSGIARCIRIAQAANFGFALIARGGSYGEQINTFTSNIDSSLHDLAVPETNLCWGSARCGSVNQTQ